MKEFLMIEMNNRITRGVTIGYLSLLFDKIIIYAKVKQTPKLKQPDSVAGSFKNS